MKNKVQIRRRKSVSRQQAKRKLIANNKFKKKATLVSQFKSFVRKQEQKAQEEAKAKQEKLGNQKPGFSIPNLLRGIK